MSDLAAMRPDLDILTTDAFSNLTAISTDGITEARRDSSSRTNGEESFISTSSSETPRSAARRCWRWEGMTKRFSQRTRTSSCG